MKDSVGRPSSVYPWCNRILRLFEKFERGPEEVGVVVDLSAPFLEKAWRECLRAMFPATNLLETNEITPFHVGSLVGHKHGYNQFLVHSIRRFEPVAIKLAEKHEQLRALFGQFQARAPEIQRMSLRITERCLSIALQQDRRESAEFFEGFAKALSVGSVTEAGTLEGMGQMTQICFFIALRGAKIQTDFRSVAEFHGFLTKHFGQNIVGSLERIQKICNRFGLRFSRPGRPSSLAN